MQKDGRCKILCRSRHHCCFNRANLHDGAGGEHFFLHVAVVRRAAHRGKEAHRILCRHGFARSRFSAHNDRLIPLISTKETKKTSGLVR